MKNNKLRFRWQFRNIYVCIFLILLCVHVNDVWNVKLLLIDDVVSVLFAMAYVIKGGHLHYNLMLIYFYDSCLAPTFLWPGSGVHARLTTSCLQANNGCGPHGVTTNCRCTVFSHGDDATWWCSALPTRSKPLCQLLFQQILILC